MFAVPLYAMMQTLSDEEERSQVVAGNNILNALYIAVGSVVAGMILDAGYSVPDLFLIVAVLNLGIVYYMQQLRRELGSSPEGD
jgi:predicted MFS family arabinose efflux permease